MPNEWIEALKNWFLENKRPLPWRSNPSPYAVWVSEVMLQQTQAVTVIPYFERWMARFPNEKALSDAPIAEVIKLWEGLGYYARARNLHEGARHIVEQYGGKLPESAEALSSIKGIGPYTVGAIRSFAYKQKASAVDGNVARVMARFFLIEEVLSPAVMGKIRQMVDQLLPDYQPWVIMEALIELGAQVCGKKPRCDLCPLQRDCLAYKQRREKELPLKGRRPVQEWLFRLVPLVCVDDFVLVRQEKEKKLMQGLYAFPYIEWKREWQTGFEQAILSFFPFEVSFESALDPVEHTFTRYKARLFPSLWQAKEKASHEQWVPRSQLLKLPFCGGHRQIASELSRM